jgi:hypothetical protein
MGAWRGARQGRRPAVPGCTDGAPLKPEMVGVCVTLSRKFKRAGFVC